MPKKYLIAIDQGTTSSRAVIYNENLAVVGLGQQAFAQYFPKPGWVEHDLGEIWESVKKAIAGALASVKDPEFRVTSIAGIGITNQRETFGLWERRSGQALGRAIVWQCRRSSQICQRLKKNSAGRELAKITGLVIDPYFSGTKVKYWLDEEKSLRARAAKGEIAFGTMDSFLIWKLTGGKVHATDVTNASRTLFMDLKTRRWSARALKILAVPGALLPQIHDSDATFGSTLGLEDLPDGIPICGVLGDQQAALFGQACFRRGEAKITYGTGAFFLINIGEKIRRTLSGVTTVAWTAGGRSVYALEGSVFIAGAAVQWLRDGLKLIEKSAEIETLARSVEDSAGVFFIPALSGLGAPDWFAEARGLIGGLSRGSTRAHLARATLEGIAASISDAFDGLIKDGGMAVKKIKVDGGASSNDILVQRQADLLQCEMERPQDLESTARGAASIAAFNLGWVNLNELREKNPVVKKLSPQISRAQANKEKSIWRRRVEALKQGAY